MSIHLSALVFVRNKDGKLITKRKLRLHSATYSFAQFMFEMFTAQVSPSIQYSPITLQELAGYTAAVSPTSVTPGSGAVLSLEPVASSFGANGTTSQVDNPIIGLGTGTTAFSPGTAQIADVLLIYSAYSSSEPTPNLTESSAPGAYANNPSITYASFYFSPATFQNNTSSSITVSNLGWYANLELTSPSAAYTVLMTYDVISPAITIAAGGTLTITYTVELE